MLASSLSLTSKQHRRDSYSVCFCSSQVQPVGHHVWRWAMTKWVFTWTTQGDVCIQHGNFETKKKLPKGEYASSIFRDIPNTSYTTTHKRKKSLVIFQYVGNESLGGVGCTFSSVSHRQTALNLWIKYVSQFLWKSHRWIEHISSRRPQWKAHCQRRKTKSTVQLTYPHLYPTQ